MHVFIFSFNCLGTLICSNPRCNCQVCLNVFIQGNVNRDSNTIWSEMKTVHNSCSYKRNGLFIWHASCSYGPRNNDEKINQNTQKVLALLQLHTNSLPYKMSEKILQLVGGFYGIDTRLTRGEFAQRVFFMQTLSLIDQGFQDWPQVFPQLHNNVYQFITSLNLHSNQLKRIDAESLSFMPLLQSLDLSRFCAINNAR